MNSIANTITTALHAVWSQFFSELEFPKNSVITRPEDWQFGEYTVNLAMVAFPLLPAELKAKSPNPRALAQLFADELKNALPTVTITVAGPGFINFSLSSSDLISEVNSVSSQTSLPTKFSNKQVIVEFTDPNPFKEFHIGHLYSNIVGESISRLLEVGGAQVHRACYQGDVGMHVAKSIWGLRSKLVTDQLTLSELELRTLPDRVKYLGQAYALGATAYEEQPTAAEEIKDINYMVFIFGQENLMKVMDWQPQVDYRSKLSSDPKNLDEIRELYVKGRAWSLAYFETIYARLGTKFEEYFFESLVGELGLQLVRESQAKGIFVESQGAVIYPGSQKKLHDRVFINSHGLPTYEAKELGLAPEKYRRIPYDHSIIITGNEIVEYFKVLLTALSEIHPELAAKTTHLSHGMVRLPDGKMSSRTGKILTGEWLLDESKAEVKKILDVSQAEGKLKLSTEELDHTAELIGQAAIKFALLSSRLGKDISFDFTNSLSFAGFSGPYLQYTVTRCQSVLSKAAAQQIQFTKKLAETEAITADERLVLIQLSRAPEVTTQAISNLSPHIIAEYLFALSQSFNSFYTNQQILNSEHSSFRLALTEMVAKTVTSGLYLLGITSPERM